MIWKKLGCYSVLQIPVKFLYILSYYNPKNLRILCQELHKSTLQVEESVYRRLLTVPRTKTPFLRVSRRKPSRKHGSKWSPFVVFHEPCRVHIRCGKKCFGQIRLRLSFMANIQNATVAGRLVRIDGRINGLKIRGSPVNKTCRMLHKTWGRGSPSSRRITRHGELQ